MSANLKFDSDTHTYSVDRRVVPGVTTILRCCGLTGAYEFRDPIHAYRGTAVHEGGAMIIAGLEPHLHPLEPPHSTQGNYVQVHSEIPGYWDAIRGAQAAIKFTGCIYEAAFIDPLRGHGGKFDFFAFIPSKRQLWDLKSGTYPEMTVVQMCGYEDLARRGHPVDPEHPGLPWLRELMSSGEEVERCGLRVEKTGRWTAFYETSKGEHYGLPKWVSAWRSCLALYTLVPDHHYLWTDPEGHTHKKSRLADMNWVAQQVRDRLTGLDLERCLRAGENIFNLRQAYGLL